MKKLLTILAVGLSVFSLSAQAAKLKELSNSKLNIIFIFADDWGYGDLSAHGHQGLKTPNLDKMIAEGTEFQQFNVCSPVCSSSRTAVMTGNFPSRHGMHEHIAGHELNAARGMPDYLDPSVVMLPRLLQQAGYKTAHYGKWHLSNTMTADVAPVPMDYGYDDTRVFNGSGPAVAGGPKDYHSSALTTNCVKYTIDFIKKHKDTSPFFVNLWIHESHQAIEPTPEQREPYKDVAEPQQSYYSVITSADAQLGKLFAYLKESGLDKNTLVLFSSDNGPESNANEKTWQSVGVTAGLRGQKRSLFEGGVKVPFIVRLPDYIPAGQLNKDSVIAAVDLLPTFCDIAGVKLPEGYKPDGEVVTKALQGSKYDRSKTILQYWQGNSSGNNWPRLSAKNTKWKLYTNFDKSKIELYDYKHDWAEENNLASQHPEIVEKLLAEAFEYYKSLNITHDNSKPGGGLGSRHDLKTKKEKTSKKTKE